MVTYGPGAILEGRAGPRVIPQPDVGLFNQRSGLHPADFEITDQRMTEGLLEGRGRVFRLPSNAERQIPDTQPTYYTHPFPNWRLCINNNFHPTNFSALYLGGMCPVCNIGDRTSQEPIRFVVACPDGHMDDVDWIGLVRHTQTCQNSRWLRWLGGGGSIGDIVIECPNCQGQVRLGIAYGLPHRCSGRFVEREELNRRPARLRCELNARIIQRQASNLRVPELKTLFTVHPRDTQLHILLENTAIRSAITALGGNVDSRDELSEILTRLVDARLITRVGANEILRHPWDEIKNAMRAVMTPVPTSYTELIQEEFRSLVRGSIEGIPPVRGPPPISPVLLEINPRLASVISCQRGRRMRVVPVSRLRTVTVQRGYRREVDTEHPSDLVDIGFPDPASPGHLWYPGVQFFGEGIFVSLEGLDRQFEMTGPAVERWQRIAGRGLEYPRYVFRDPTRAEELSPIFIWWHTLSHLLLRSASVQSGYSTASIRERVYLEIVDNGHFRGGVLFYATQPGSEGTLGGLIALVPHFEQVLNTALSSAQACSGDPLCATSEILPGGYNGAACYGCLLVSETSCEHRNMWLDRKILIENLP